MLLVIETNFNVTICNEYDLAESILAFLLEDLAVFKLEGLEEAEEHHRKVVVGAAQEVLAWT